MNKIKDKCISCKFSSYHNFLNISCDLHRAKLGDGCMCTDYNKYKSIDDKDKPTKDKCVTCKFSSYNNPDKILCYEYRKSLWLDPNCYGRNRYESIQKSINPEIYNSFDGEKKEVIDLIGKNVWFSDGPQSGWSRPRKLIDIAINSNLAYNINGAWYRFIKTIPIVKLTKKEILKKFGYDLNTVLEIIE